MKSEHAEMIGGFIRKAQPVGSFPAPMKSTAWEFTVLGGLLVGRLTRVFRNEESKPIEATVTFPVPFEAAVTGLAVKVGGRTLRGTAKAKEQARETYEEAVDAGKAAVLHEELLRGIHMVSVANVAPETEIEVTAEFVMPLSLEGTTGSARVPVTVGDVYGAAPFVDSDAPLAGGAASDASVTVTCAAGRVTVNDVETANGKATVRTDVPIDLRVAGLPEGALAATGRAADGRRVEVTVSAAAHRDGPLDGDLLLDVSGSMNDLVCAREGGRTSKWQALLSGLSAASGTAFESRDSLRIWTFSSSCRQVASCRGDGLAAALGGVPFDSGGTRLAEAVETVTKARSEANVLLVTDGKSWTPIDVQAAVASGARFTVVLVGEDSLESSVGYLAALTGGRMFPVAGAGVAETVRRAAASMRGVASPAAAFEGDPEKVARSAGGSEVTAVWAKARGKQPAREGDARAVAAYAAHLAMPGMDGERAAALAEAEGLVTHLTSLVLVDEEAEAVEGVPAHRKVALPTPATAFLVASAASAGAPQMRAMAFAGAPVQSMAPSCSVKGARGRHFPGYGQAWGGVILPGGGRSAFPEPPFPELSFPDLTFPETAFPESAVPDGLPVLTPAEPAAGDLTRLRGLVDWDRDPDALARGDVSGLTPIAALTLAAAARTDAVKALARSLGADAKAVAVAIAAKAEAASSRSAARIARQVLGQADARLLAEAQRATGL